MEMAIKFLTRTLDLLPPDISDSQKINLDAGGFHYQSDCDGSSTDRVPMILNPTAATLKNELPYHLAMAFECPPLWGRLSSNVFPFYKERAIEKRIEVDSSQNCAWKAQGCYDGKSAASLLYCSIIRIHIFNNYSTFSSLRSTLFSKFICSPPPFFSFYRQPKQNLPFLLQDLKGSVT